MTRTFFAISLLFVLFLTGCASFKNDVAAGDSIFGSYKGDYVVVNATGGVIADVWVLRAYQVKFNRDDVAGRYHLRGRADGLFSRRVC